MRQTSMPPAGFEHVISASERPQAHALDRATNGIGTHRYFVNHKSHINSSGIKHRFHRMQINNKNKLLYGKADSGCTVKCTELHRG